MDFFTPQQQKDAISERVESDIGSMLEDLIVAAWLAYGYTRDRPESSAAQTAASVINTFELHQLGWRTSRLIPDRHMLEGEDTTLEARIGEYCDLARKHSADLRPSLIMLLGFIYLWSRETPEDLMHQWVLGAMKRHRLSPDIYTNKSAESVNVVFPGSSNVQ